MVHSLLCSSFILMVHSLLCSSFILMVHSLLCSTFILMVHRCLCLWTCREIGYNSIMECMPVGGQDVESNMARHMV